MIMPPGAIAFGIPGMEPTGFICTAFSGTFFDIICRAAY